VCGGCYISAVPREKTIIDVLAELQPDELNRMCEKNRRDLARARVEVGRLELQEQQFEAAVQKRERGKPGRPGALNLDLVLDAASETEPPMSAADVRETLLAAGHEASVNAVRNHLNRLVEGGDLRKDEKGQFSVPTPAFVPAPTAADSAPFPEAADDDIPF
jgi:cytochrome P450